MRLYSWQGTVRNFGDELNTLLWPRLLPSFFDEDPGTRFIGIGSVFDARHPDTITKIVAGAGYGGYDNLARLDDTWRIYWVRGPHTAQVYGLAPELALGDPASLVPHIVEQKPPAARNIGFMPHFESAARGNWTRVAADAGVQVIDPTGDPATTIEMIAGCKLIISEALHGIIVADALRVPWIAVRPIAPVHRAKWWDWAETLQLDLRFQHLPPSSLLELAHASPLTRCHPGRMLLERHAATLRKAGSMRFMDHAAASLAAVMSQEPQLSTESVLDRCQARMMERLHVLRHNSRPGLEPGLYPVRFSHLRPDLDFAYHAP